MGKKKNLHRRKTNGGNAMKNELTFRYAERKDTGFNIAIHKGTG